MKKGPSVFGQYFEIPDMLFIMRDIIKGVPCNPEKLSLDRFGGPPFWGLYVHEFHGWTPFWGAVC